MNETGNEKKVMKRRGRGGKGSQLKEAWTNIEGEKQKSKNGERLMKDIER